MGIDIDTFIEHVAVEYGTTDSANFPKKKVKQDEAAAMVAFGKHVKDYDVDQCLYSLGLSYDGMTNPSISQPNTITDLTVNIFVLLNLPTL